MAYKVLPDGSIETDDVEEAVRLAAVMAARKKAAEAPEGPSEWKPNRPNGRGTVAKSGRFGWRWSVMVSRKRHVGPTYGSKQEALQELEKYIETGIMSPKPPRAPYRCSLCLGDGHTKKRCPHGRGEAVVVPVAAATVVPAVVATEVVPAVVAPVAVATVEEEVEEMRPLDDGDLNFGKFLSRMKVERRKCSICEETGHNANRCPTVPHEPKMPKRGAKPAKEVASVVFDKPFAVVAGQQFFVVEDFVEEETGTKWKEGDLWTAVAPTGKSHPDGYDEWRMVQGSARKISYPQLHPFLATAKRPLLSQ